MPSTYLLGLDVGSSSVKASIVNASTGRTAASAFFPKQEAPITAVKAGWAEQDPGMWWENAKLAMAQTMKDAGVKGTDIAAIGISYQMHGLVCVGKDMKPLRPSIIWCDSRAVPYGEKAFDHIGHETCLSHIMPSLSPLTVVCASPVRQRAM